MATKKKKASGRSARKRRGAGNDMTGAKDATVEVRTAQADMALPKPDDMEFHRKQILGFKEQKESANGRYRNAIKRAKEARIDVDALLFAHSLKNKNDLAGTKRHFEQLSMAMGQEGFPLNLIIHDPLLGDVKDAAYKRGANAAEKGEFSNCPYPEGSDLAAEYQRGWEEATAKRVMGDNGEGEQASLDVENGDLSAPLPAAGQSVEHATAH